MLKDDINVGDLLRTDIDPPNAPWNPEDIPVPERMVLVVSLETAEMSSGESGYVTVLDCGVMTSVCCVWLWPGDQSSDLYYR